MKHEGGIIGLGKMGGNVALRLLKKKWRVAGFNRSPGDTRVLAKKGLVAAFSLQETVALLQPPRIVWLMLPAGAAVDAVIFGRDGLLSLLARGDTIIDGGNSYFKDTMRRAEKIAASRRGVNFFDVGVSGGPSGALHGACLMIGGVRKSFSVHEDLFRAMSVKDGYAFFEGVGAGHFVKMVHNGIEYGMMQAIAEGFEVMKKSRFKLDLGKVAAVYNRGSVVESRLIGWLLDAFNHFGADLKKISGSVQSSGEGAWTVKTARELKVPVKVIEDALKFRLASEKRPSYTGKILSALRNRFGGHSVR